MMDITQRSSAEPILDMIALGEPRNFGKWIDYTAIGITTKHIPQLLELMTAMEYHHSYDETEIWIPLHAWRALAQVHAASMQRPFAQLLLELKDDDWIGNDTPHVVELLGPATLPGWFEILDQFESVGRYGCGNAILEGIWTIGQTYVESRRYVTDEFISRLERFATLDEGYNGFLIMGLLKLRARRALPLIAEAFSHNAVDGFIENWSRVIDTFRLPPSSRPEDYLNSSLSDRSRKIGPR